MEGDTTHENTASQHVMTAVGMQLIAQDEHLKYYRIPWDDTQIPLAPESAKL